MFLIRDHIHKRPQYNPIVSHFNLIFTSRLIYVKSILILPSRLRVSVLSVVFLSVSRLKFCIHFYVFRLSFSKNLMLGEE